MRILLLMQWFDPEPQIKGLLFAKKLRDLGNEVEVLTGFPNYPGGKIYSGYSVRPYQLEVMDGIRVTRVPLYPSHDSSPFRRILNYVSFGVSSCLAGIWLVRKSAVIYACGPPVTVGVSAALISLVRRVPFIYDIQDLWPDSLGATGMFNSSYGAKVVAKVCNWVYKHARHITVQSPGVRDRLVARGLDGNKVSVIFNWCDESVISNGKHCAKGSPQDEASLRTFDVLFAGNIGKAQDLDAVLEAARIQRTENPSVRLLLLGGGVEIPRLKEVAAAHQLDNVTFLPRVPMSEVGAILARADALLVHLKDDPLFRITVPAKTQAYMAAGKPILMAVAGDAADLVSEAGAGVCAQPSDAKSISDAVRQLAAMAPANLRKMGESGREFYFKNMCLDVGVGKFQLIFQRALAENGAA
jgi:colanic acid biosynthesis glycosyl transferase WcaI